MGRPFHLPLGSVGSIARFARAARPPFSPPTLPSPLSPASTPTSVNVPPSASPRSPFSSSSPKETTSATAGTTATRRARRLGMSPRRRGRKSGGRETQARCGIGRESERLGRLDSLPIRPLLRRRSPASSGSPRVHTATRSRLLLSTTPLHRSLFTPSDSPSHPSLLSTSPLRPQDLSRSSPSTVPLELSSTRRRRRRQSTAGGRSTEPLTMMPRRHPAMDGLAIPSQPRSPTRARRSRPLLRLALPPRLSSPSRSPRWRVGASLTGASGIRSGTGGRGRR